MHNGTHLARWLPTPPSFALKWNLQNGHHLAVEDLTVLWRARGRRERALVPVEPSVHSRCKVWVERVRLNLTSRNSMNSPSSMDRSAEDYCLKVVLARNQQGPTPFQRRKA
ncbi:hypothetical protein NN3_52450 [Nocardia neocaledoniensis NBRC 108232]|nr:hypothetical protein NN3_52450 [Nocardia neocaledoniensis NBRC 108232]